MAHVSVNDRLVLQWPPDAVEALNKSYSLYEYDVGHYQLT